MRRPAPPEPIAPKPVVRRCLPEYAIAGGAAGHTEMVQRTLFNPTRRPAPGGAGDRGEAQMQRGQFALTGTLVIDGKSTAFLREVAGNKSRRVLAGEKINGMLVAEVKPDRVRLTLGDESEELMLKVAPNPRPTVAQPAPDGGCRQRLGTAPRRRRRRRRPLATPCRLPATGEPAQTLAERRRAARRRRGRAAAGRPPAAAAPATAGGNAGAGAPQAAAAECTAR